MKISDEMLEELGIEDVPAVPKPVPPAAEVTDADVQKWLKDHNLKAEPIVKRDVRGSD